MGHLLGEFEQLICLALLQLGRKAYGVLIRRVIEERTGRDVSVGAVYTTLDRLEKKNFVVSRTGDPRPERGGRRRKYYHLTPEGIAVLSASYDAWKRMSEGCEALLEGCE